jgi:ankyrin repeat protein
VEPEPNVNGAKICDIPLIECTLKTVDLQDEPKYDALSYTWGSPFPAGSAQAEDYSINRKWPIAVNNRLLYVTRNLYEALKQFHPDTDPDPNVDKRGPPYNKTRLIEAAEEGRTDEVRSLLLKGADVKSTDCFGETALHYAAENGHFDVVKLLVKAGSNLTTLDHSRRTPLACCEQRKKGKWEEVAAFLKDPASRVNGTSDSQTLANDRQLWIDAICINQNDISERNAQVAVMSHIYSAANTVLVWLGIENGATDIAKEAMDRINSADQQKDNLWFSATWRYSQSRSNNHMDQDWTSEESIVSIRQLHALSSLLRRAWFQRVWVIQEVTMARRIEVHCGSRQFRWDDFFELVQHRLGKAHHLKALGDSQSPPVKYGKGQRGTEAWTITDLRMRTKPNDFEKSHLNVMKTNLGKEIIRNWNEPLTLPVLLLLTWTFRSTDPHDKIFALLNIARHVEGTPAITADYAMPVEDLYAEVGRLFVTGTREDTIQDWHSGEVEDFESLEGLSFVQEVLDRNTSRLARLPSWVPDFSLALVTPRLWSTRFNATKGLSPSFPPPPNPHLMHLTSLCFDTVVEVENKPRERPIGSSISYNITSWFALISPMDAEYPTGIPLIEALWRTLMVGNIWSTNENGDADARESFADFITSDLSKAPQEYLDRSLGLMAQLPPGADDTHCLPSAEDIERYKESHGHGAPDHVCIPDAPQHKQKRNFHSSFTQNYRTRRLFRTAKGYLGLAPRSTQPGDQVWLLAGARVPFILRRGEDDGSDTYRFIGETYLHGVMHGEAVEGKENEFKPITLV